MIRTLNEFQRHQAYIDVARAEPADMLPTLLSCSSDDLRFLFQDLPSGLSGVSGYWKNAKNDLRVFAVRLMRESTEANVKLLQDLGKLELLGIDLPVAVEEVEVDALRQYLLSQSDNPEESIRSLDPLLRELRQRYGDRVPADQLRKFVSDQKRRLKVEMRSLIETAQAEGKSASVEELAQGMKARIFADAGPERDDSIRKMDDYVVSLRAEYGDRIPVGDLFRLLQQLERDLGNTDTIHQPSSAAYGACFSRDRLTLPVSV
jgi:hypothetical protein